MEGLKIILSKNYLKRKTQINFFSQVKKMSFKLTQKLKALSYPQHFKFSSSYSLAHFRIFCLNFFFLSGFQIENVFPKLLTRCQSWFSSYHSISRHKEYKRVSRTFFFCSYLKQYHCGNKLSSFFTHWVLTLQRGTWFKINTLCKSFWRYSANFEG